MIAFFRTRQVKILIWQKFSETWESDFDENFYDIVKVWLIMINNVNIFTIYESLL